MYHNAIKGGFTGGGGVGRRNSKCHNFVEKDCCCSWSTPDPEVFGGQQALDDIFTKLPLHQQPTIILTRWCRYLLAWSAEVRTATIASVTRWQRKPNIGHTSFCLAWRKANKLWQELLVTNKGQRLISESTLLYPNIYHKVFSSFSVSSWLRCVCSSYHWPQARDPVGKDDETRKTAIFADLEYWVTYCVSLTTRQWKVTSPCELVSKKVHRETARRLRYCKSTSI